ncbi:MAG: cryptochrome/photolyase family protein, partial [Janthinobacterium lividum]
PVPAPVIVWFRQDLRLADNPALRHALNGGHAVLPVFVLDRETPAAWATGGAGCWWLHHSLAALARGLQARGAALLLRRGRWEEVLPALAEEVGATEIHAGRLHEPWAAAADARLDTILAGAGRKLHLHRASTLVDPETIRTKTGGTYGVYGPFRKAFAARGEPEPPQPAPDRIPIPALPRSDALDSWGLLPSRPDWASGFREQWQVGEDAAQAKLRHFLSHTLDDYERTRNAPAEEGTSQLSPHLHWGEISPAQAWDAARQAAPAGGPGLERFRDELVWHDFSAYLLRHYPDTPDAPLKPEFGRMPWRTAPEELRAWQCGRTGIPIVDAGMRQLWRIGWMHNRIRMVTASFLIKHLLVSWQDGERWFWDTLVDGDLATNSVSWQWVAGTGADPQPFFRVFNPVLQGQKFDAAGDYVRRWVPELAALPARFIHTPWLAPGNVLREAGVTIGKTYPAPIVDLAEGRRRALEALRRIGRKADQPA